MSRRPTMPQPPLHKSTTGKTIALAIVGILALGGVGVLAGALVGGTKVPLEVEEIQGGSGNVLRPQAGGPARGQVESTPTPTLAPTPAPTPGETVVPTPAPTPTQTAPPPTGETLTIDGGTLTVPIPSGWTGGLTTDGTQAFLQTGQGDLIWLGVFNVDPAASDAAAAVAANVPYWLPPETYTQLETTQVSAQQPFGTLLSMAGMGYRALVVDAQGSAQVQGNMWAAIRGDGKMLGVTADSTPPERFLTETWRQIVDPALNSFAGTGV